MCLSPLYLHLVTPSFCQLPRPEFRKTYHRHPLHACFVAAGQGATAVVNGDEIVGAAALEANTAESADPNALLSV